MKKYIYLYLVLVISNISCNTKKSSRKGNSPDKVIETLNTPKDYEGEWVWEKNDDRKDFSINIKIKGDDIMGKYCSIAQSGNRVDCAEGNNYNFEIKNVTQNHFTTNFKTNYSMSEGSVKLTLESSKKIIWKIVKSPKGEYYCPKYAVLIKKKD